MSYDRHVGAALALLLRLLPLGLLLGMWLWWRRGKRHANAHDDSIVLRYSRMLREPDLGLRVGIDIGGSLAKLVFIEKEDGSGDTVGARLLQYITGSTTYGSTGVRDQHLEVSVPSLHGRLHFIRFDSSQVPSAVAMLRQQELMHGFLTIHATGGGAHKFKALIEESLAVKLKPYSELGTVVLGICFMTRMVENECYTFERVPDPSQRGRRDEHTTVTVAAGERRACGGGQPRSHRPELKLSASQYNIKQIPLDRHLGHSRDFFPFLLCNVGTGVSILHVKSETDYERVSGTALGGGTFLGLCRLLTQADSFAEALDLAEAGDARAVDITVQDIYGPSSDRSGLKLDGDLTASFFARVANLPRRSHRGDADAAAETPPEDAATTHTDADLCKAAVVMISQNVAQVAHLNARLHGLRRVFFTGNFLRGNAIAQRTIVYTMGRLPEKEPTTALFFRHEGYFGAIGAYLQTCRADDPASQMESLSGRSDKSE